MPMLKGEYIGSFVGYDFEDPNCDLAVDLGGYGHIQLYESLSLHPGDHFVRFFYNSQGPNLGYTDRYLTTGCGELEIDGSTLRIKGTHPTGNTLTFEIERELEE